MDSFHTFHARLDAWSCPAVSHGRHPRGDRAYNYHGLCQTDSRTPAAREIGKINLRGWAHEFMAVIEMSARREGVMSQISLINEAPVDSGRISPHRTWAGTLVKAGEHATHYLHLMAFPCEKCKGPVVAGWTCKREDDITKETETTGMGAICLSCGSRPEALIDPLQACHFRPVKWEWVVEKTPAALEPNGDLLPAELSQDADHPDSPRFAAGARL